MYFDPGTIHDRANRLAEYVSEFKPPNDFAFSVAGSDTSLVSVQSFFQQQSELFSSTNGIKQLIQWHLFEGKAVAGALHACADALKANDDGLSEVFASGYNTLAEKMRHSNQLLPAKKELRVGGGFAMSDGRHFPTFTGCGTQLAPEPLGRSAEEYCNEFLSVDRACFHECFKAWNDLAVQLDDFRDSVRGIARSLEGMKDDDTFTYPAALGIYRWADSIDGTVKALNRIATNTDEFYYGFKAAQESFDELQANTKYRETDPESTAQRQALETEWIEHTLNSTYNPAVERGDSSAVEFAVPMRAIHPEKILPSYVNVPPLRGRTDYTPGIAGATEVPGSTRTQPIPPSEHHDVTPPQFTGVQENAAQGGANSGNAAQSGSPLAAGQGPGFGQNSELRPAGTNTAAWAPTGHTGTGTAGTSPGTGVRPPTGTGSGAGSGSGQESSVLSGRQGFNTYDPSTRQGPGYSYGRHYGSGNGSGVGGSGRSGSGSATGVGTGAGPASSGPGAGAGRGMGMMPAGMAGAGRKDEIDKSRPFRPRKHRNSENTKHILNIPDAPPQVLRHPSDPNYGKPRHVFRRPDARGN